MKKEICPNQGHHHHHEKIKVTVKYVGKGEYTELLTANVTLQAIKLLAMKTFELELLREGEYALQHNGADQNEMQPVGVYKADHVTFELTLKCEPNKGAEATLDEFWASHNWEQLSTLNKWITKRNGDTIDCELPAKDGEVYRLRLICNNYPHTPPSVAFINEQGSKSDAKAWPKGGPNFMGIVKPPQNSFLCTGLTREGLAHHQDWKNQPHAWNAERNTVLDVLNMVHRLLHSAEYLGRGGAK